MSDAIWYVVAVSGGGDFVMFNESRVYSSEEKIPRPVTRKKAEFRALAARSDWPLPDSRAWEIRVVDRPEIDRLMVQKVVRET